MLGSMTGKVVVAVGGVLGSVVLDSPISDAIGVDRLLDACVPSNDDRLS